jgi:hypothetical protein
MTEEQSTGFRSESLGDRRLVPTVAGEIDDG